MTLLEIIALLFKKIGDKSSIMKGIKNFWNMPQLLKIVFITTLIIGSIYFGYSRIYTYQINEIKIELDDINSKIKNNLTDNAYEDDMYYIFEAILSLEHLITYRYQEEYMELNVLKQQMLRNHPNDPMIQDIDNMIQRNNTNLRYYRTEFKRSLYKCNPKIYMSLHDSIP